MCYGEAQGGAVSAIAPRLLLIRRRRFPTRCVLAVRPAANSLRLTLKCRRATLANCEDRQAAL